MAYINKNVSTMAMPSGMNRMGQFPLDMSSVYYDMDSLVAYATSGAIAYVGQVVSLVDEENNKVTVYSIQDKAGTLKEVGTVPVGDEKTIEVAENGTVSLAGVDSLTFTEEVEGENGEKTTIDVTYQALLTKDGLTWVQPSKTTVEGLATLIEGLTGRVSALESKVGKAAEGENAATGLFKAIADEAARAAGAEEALGERIDAIDFIDEDELAKALEPYAKADDVDKAIDDAVKGILGENIAEAYDTLKEIQDILEGTDGEAIDGLIETVDANKQAIATLNGTGAGSVDKKIADAISTANLDQYVEDTEFATYKTEVTAAIGTAKSEATGYTDTQLTGYYAKGEVDNLIKDFATDDEVAAAVAAEAEIARAAEKKNEDAIKAIKDDADLDSFADVSAALGNYATTNALNTAVQSLKDNEIKAAADVAQSAKQQAEENFQTANTALANAHSNSLNISELDKAINGYTPDSGEHVDGLVQKVASNITRIGNAEGKISVLEGTSHTHAKTDVEISDAVDKRHAHANSEELAKINSGDVEKWNSAEQNAKTYAKNYADGLADNYAASEHKHTKADITDFAHTHEISEVNGLSKAISDAQAEAESTAANALSAYQNEMVAALAGKQDVIPANTYDAYGAAAQALADAKSYADANDADTKYGIVYDSENKKIKLVSDTSKTEIDATDFIKDGMIESVTLSENGLDLIITWNTDSNKGENNVTTIPLSGLVDVYTGVDGTTVKVEVSSDNKISAEVKDNAIKNAHIASDAAIAKSKLASDVQASLDLADTAIQAADLGTMATEAAADYVKKSDAVGYADILTKTAAQGLYQAKGEYASAAQGAKADTAIQSVAAGNGLKVTADANDATKLTIDIDEAVVFVFDGGSATSNW